MQDNNSKIKKQRLKVGMVAALLLSTITLAACDTGEVKIADDSVQQSVIVIEMDDEAYGAPMMIEDLTDERQIHYLSFIYYMDRHTTQPRFVFQSADRLAGRDKYEFAWVIQGFLAEQDVNAERELLSWQDSGGAMYRVPIASIRESVGNYLGTDFDVAAAFGISRGLTQNGTVLGYDPETDEYVTRSAGGELSGTNNYNWQAGLLDYTETDDRMVELSVGFYSALEIEDADRTEYSLHYDLRYVYDLTIRPSETDNAEFTVVSSRYKTFDADGSVMVLDTPWDYQTPGRSEDIPRVLANMDNAVTQPGSELSEEDILSLFERILPAGFEVRMWYLDNGAQTLTPGSDPPITIDAREDWYTIGRYFSIEEMKAATRTILSDEYCEAYLYSAAFNEVDCKYKEFELRLYENQNTGGVSDFLSFHTQSAGVVSQAAGELVISLPYSHQSDESGAQSEFDFRLIQQDGRWVFDNWPPL